MAGATQSGSSMKKAREEFVKRWKGLGEEKQEAQTFWLDLLESLFGIPISDRYIRFEGKVHLKDSTKFLDGYIEKTKVVIEQKSLGADLSKPQKQSGGIELTPYQQAKRYVDNLPASKRANWIIVSNFEEFWIYNLEKTGASREVPQILKLEELVDNENMLSFLEDPDIKKIEKEQALSIEAGKIVGRLYKLLLDEFGKNPTQEQSKHLNKLCVRLVFCLYAEDARILGPRKLMFHDYLKRRQKLGAQGVRDGLVELFKVLSTPEDERDSFGDAELNAFAYVNGGLFEDTNYVIPRFTDEIVELLLDQASAGINWSKISPTIFGAVFESTLNPETRRSGGMHYTSIKNIHKVIDPLFLDDLKDELSKIEDIKTLRKRHLALLEYQKKLGSLKFLDPACGSGNFLTETYLELRRLENRVLTLLGNGQSYFGGELSPIQVSLDHFYGIEINDFAVSVAQTALWIAESQMMQETQDIVNDSNLHFLPLKSHSNIVKSNALEEDWNKVVPSSELNFMIGNPPFVGFTFMTSEQKADMEVLFPKIKNLDYVAGWFKKATDYIHGTSIQCAFVATNSITQGETADRLWHALPPVNINFAWRSFRWSNETSSAATVYCVILGFSEFSKNTKTLYDESGRPKTVSNINAYLLNAPNVLVSSRNKPLCKVPRMVYGNKPVDGGHLLLSQEERNELISKEPLAEKWIRPVLGAKEFLYNLERYCLWLEGANPAELAKCPLVLERIEQVKETRLNSIAPAIHKFAEIPSLFAQRTQPINAKCLVVPRTTASSRTYIPIGYIEPPTIVTDLVQLVPNATLYHLGVLTSSLHMAWMKTTAGRLGIGYRYSKDIVYNNFIWPSATADQIEKISKTAQNILDVRHKYPDASLHVLYDSSTMPIDLLQAHKANDKAVLAAYGLKANITEAEIVEHLFNLYIEETDKLDKAKSRELEEKANAKNSRRQSKTKKLSAKVRKKTSVA